MQKKYVLIGVGSRADMFLNFFSQPGQQEHRLVAICDANEGRLVVFLERLPSTIAKPAPFAANQFDAMVAEHKPDCVIVCTMDSTHDDYICRALEAGCDVITEKPMTTDAAKCQRIVDTAERTGRKVRVLFNYRYTPVRSQIKELLMEGVIGRVLAVDMQWMLDTSHGADYFRRWHRNKANSGGLAVHKATHHFDLINWWLSQVPAEVSAMGCRQFYTPRQAQLYGLDNRTERCLDCPEKARCNFYLDLNTVGRLKGLYLDQEKYDGYVRDRCVFSKDIDIEDSLRANVRYADGCILSYSLVAFSPWEGYRVQFTGTKGRLEHNCRESSYVNGDGTVQGAFEPEGTSIRIFPQFKTPYEVEPRQGVGAHGGGDTVLLDDVFGASNDDPLKRSASHLQGAYSILTGIAINESIRSGRFVQIGDLVTGLADPGYPEMDKAAAGIDFVPEFKIEGKISVG